MGVGRVSGLDRLMGIRMFRRMLGGFLMICIMVTARLSIISQLIMAVLRQVKPFRNDVSPL